MKMSFYNMCMLITRDEDVNFGIIKLQTDNTFNIEIEIFMNKEDVGIIKTRFKSKSYTMLETSILRNFNGCRIIIEDKAIMVVQKN